jgi:hypothetical protein
MKAKFLGTVAAFAFIATGLAAQAQDAPRQDNKGAERAAPAGGEGGKAGGAMQNKMAPKAAEGERRDQKAETPNKEAPKAAQVERRETEGADHKDTMRADPARGDEPKSAQSEKRGDPDVKRPGQTGEKAVERNADRGEPRVSGVKISREHASRIGETLRREGRPQRATFDVRVGGRVPEDFEVRPLPPEIVEIEPQYRGYNYFVDTDDEIVFVSPETHEIVGSIGYEGRAAALDAPRAARPCPTED